MIHKRIIAISIDAINYGSSWLTSSIGLKEVAGDIEYYSSISHTGDRNERDGDEFNNESLSHHPNFETVWMEIERLIGPDSGVLFLSHNPLIDYPVLEKDIFRLYSEIDAPYLYELEKFSSLIISENVFQEEDVENKDLLTIYKHFDKYGFLEGNKMEEARATAFIVEKMHSISSFSNKSIAEFVVKNGRASVDREKNYQTKYSGGAPVIKYFKGGLPTTTKKFVFSGAFFTEDGTRIKRTLIAESFENTGRFRKVENISQADIVVIGDTGKHGDAKKIEEANGRGVQVVMAKDVEFGFEGGLKS